MKLHGRGGGWAGDMGDRARPPKTKTAMTHVLVSCGGVEMGHATSSTRL